MDLLGRSRHPPPRSRARPHAQGTADRVTVTVAARRTARPWRPWARRARSFKTTHRPPSRQGQQRAIGMLNGQSVSFTVDPRGAGAILTEGHFRRRTSAFAGVEGRLLVRARVGEHTARPTAMRARPRSQRTAAPTRLGRAVGSSPAMSHSRRRPTSRRAGTLEGRPDRGPRQPRRFKRHIKITIAPARADSGRGATRAGSPRAQAAHSVGSARSKRIPRTRGSLPWGSSAFQADFGATPRLTRVGKSSAFPTPILRGLLAAAPRRQ